MDKWQMKAFNFNFKYNMKHFTHFDRFGVINWIALLVIVLQMTLDCKAETDRIESSTAISQADTADNYTEFDDSKNKDSFATDDNDGVIMANNDDDSYVTIDATAAKISEENPMQISTEVNQIGKDTFNIDIEKSINTESLDRINVETTTEMFNSSENVSKETNLEVFVTESDKNVVKTSEKMVEILNNTLNLTEDIKDVEFKNGSEALSVKKVVENITEMFNSTSTLAQDLKIQDNKDKNDSKESFEKKIEENSMSSTENYANATNIINSDRTNFSIATHMKVIDVTEESTTLSENNKTSSTASDIIDSNNSKYQNDSIFGNKEENTTPFITITSAERNEDSSVATIEKVDKAITIKNHDEIEDRYVTIAFVTNNPKITVKPRETTTHRMDRSTNVEDEVGLFKFWTTQSESRSNIPNKDAVPGWAYDSSSDFIRNDGPIKGHYVTVKPLESQSKIGEDLDLETVEDEDDEEDDDDDDDSDESDDYDIENNSNDEEFIKEAADYGMQKMKELYEIEEPKLFHMGLWLESDNPARYVATFNHQSEEARKYARFGYASLQASTHLKKKLNDDQEGRVAGGDVNLPKLASVKKSALRELCPLRGTPRCPPASKRYRTHDGTCNNARRGRWGSSLIPVERFLPPAYSDGDGEPRGFRNFRLPSPRLVSEHVHTGRRDEAPAITHLLMQWGQFIDHDITSSSQARAFNGSIPRCCLDGGRHFVPPEFLHPECMPIEVPEDDPFYGPLGIRCLEFVRSSPAPRVDCEFGWREQMNQVTSYIDASPIYSSSARQADKLRLFRNGMLQYGRAQARRPLLPPREDDEEALCRGGAVDASCFKAGDGRVNEHPGLVAMHIIWLRKHNRLAKELAHLNPHWSDEKLYQETRKIIGALVQHITYREFLPIVLGSEVTRLFDLELVKKGYYDGYSSKVNPSPANAFGAAAFRFGHSLVQDSFMRYDRFHRPLANNVSLHDEMTNPSNIWSFGAVDRLIIGMCNQPSQKRDEYISPELTNHLFQTSKFGFGMDLAAINIQRGRDHGLPPYVEWREPCGLTSVNNWSDLLNIMPSNTVRNLRDIYRNVEDIDLFSGGMSERPVIGGLVGPTFACIIAQQFSNLRRGDRFWYENGDFDSSFTPAQLQQIRKITLAQILCQTLDSIETIQPFVFLTADNLRNSRISCDTRIINNFDLTPWTEREPDLTNDINDFDRKNLHKRTSTKSHPIHKTSTRSLSSTIQPTTISSSTSTPIKLDDKLDFSDASTTDLILEPKINLTDISDNDKHLLSNLTSSSNLDDTIINKRPASNLTNELFSERRSFSNLKDISSNFNTSSERHNKTNSIQNKPTDKHDTDSTDDSDESSVKTLGFLLNGDSQLPFLDRLFNRQTTTTKPTLRPRPNPQIEYYYDTTENSKYTYLINIVPKTTTPKYVSPQKDTIKITVQGAVPTEIRPQSSISSYNRRPVYDNNRLEYRPISTFHQIVNQDPQTSYNRPQTSNSRPIFTYNRPQTNPLSDIPDDYFNVNQHDNYEPGQTSYNRPNRPHRPIFNDYSTEYNPYTLVTFSHIETTKRYNYPNSYFNSVITPRPILNSDSIGYGQNSKPILQDKPSNTGITIYIENRPKPTSSTVLSVNQAGYGSFNSKPILQNPYNDEENVPLFTRPNYQKPFLNRPSSNSNTYHQISSVSGSVRPTFDDNKPLHSEYGQFSGSFGSQQSSYSSYKYPENKNPSTNTFKTKPSSVNINVSPQSGNHQHSDISIVIDPKLQNKPQSKPQINTHQSNYKSHSTTKPPSKYFYIGNVLYKYPENGNVNRKTSQNNKFKSDDIVRENYNNVWKPDKDEHKIYYGTSDSENDTPNSKNQNSHATFTLSNKEQSGSDTKKEHFHRKNDQLVENARGDTSNNHRTKRPSSKRRKQNKPNKINNQVAFEIMPSEISPTMWVTYNEKPEDANPAENPFNIMPKLKVDPQALSEFPRPMNFTSIFKKFNEKRIESLSH